MKSVYTIIGLHTSSLSVTRNNYSNHRSHSHVKEKRNHVTVQDYIVPIVNPMGNIVDKSEPNSSSITLKKENKGNSQKIDIPSFPNRTQHRDDNIGGTKQRLKKKNKPLSLS